MLTYKKEKQYTQYSVLTPLLRTGSPLSYGQMPQKEPVLTKHQHFCSDA